MHFERMAAEYADARPPYPLGLYELLEGEGVIGPGTRVLEIGAGSGLATRDLVRCGSEVTAVEPGPELSRLLRQEVPGVDVLEGRLEDVELPAGAFDSVVAATSMHWVDLSVALPKIHAALRPDGWLAVWRHRFGDESVDTEFRRRVEQIVAARPSQDPVARRSDDRPTMEELTADGWFEPVRTEQWRWTVDLDVDEVCRLFRTFSDWSEAEVDEAARAVEDLGGVVTEHYRTVLHLLKPTQR
jgi:SAM-dependent methyltransferase